MSKIISFAKLKLFAEVAALGSLTRAAVQLDAAPSAISRQIAQFEAECGGRLFHRTGRGVTLTELGEHILPRVKALLADAEDLGREIEGAASVPVGEVCIGILGGAANLLIPPLFRQVSRLYPGVILRVFEGPLGQLEEWVSSGKVDMAMVGRPSKQIASGEFFLKRSASYLIGAAGNPLTSEDTVDFSKLHELPLVLSGTPNGIRGLIEEIAKPLGITLTVAMEAESMTVQKAMAADGCAYTILPSYAVSREVQAGYLTAARIVNPSLERNIVLVTTTQHPLTLASREVFRLIRCISEDA
jgi:LysR family nitrogen assimilation transcriptional regulator